MKSVVHFTDYIEENYNLGIDNEKINKVIEELSFSLLNDYKIYIAGNGGSGYTGSHFAQDLIKACNFKVISLNDNWGIVSAIANDIGYDEIFKFQLERLDKRAILLLISCSGNSKNIINAAKYAKENNIFVISFTGNSGGELVQYSDIDINIPTDNIFVCESLHSMIFHYMIDILKNNKEKN